MADNERGIRRFVRLILDRTSAKQVADGMEESLAKAGADGGKAFLREIRAEFDRKMAELRHKLSKGLIDEATFRREADAAARAFNTKLSRAIDELRFKGKLTDREFQKLGRQFKRTGDIGSSAFGLVRRSLSGMAAAVGAAFGIRAVARVIRHLVSLGTAVEETASKFQTTFGAMSAGLDRFVRSFASAAGMTRRETRDMAATVGAMAQGMGAATDESAGMSESVLRLAGDLQSFHNVPIEETFAAIRSGLTGETEPMKRFGVVISAAEAELRALNDTGKRTKEELTQFELAQARLNLMIERGGAAVGDLDRTMGSSANRVRQAKGAWNELKDTFGTALVQGRAMGEFFRDLTEGLAGAETAIRANALALADLASAALQAAGAIARLASDWVRLLSPVSAETGSMVQGMLDYVRAGKDAEEQLKRLEARRAIEVQDMLRLTAAYNAQAAVVEDVKDEMRGMNSEQARAHSVLLAREEARLKDLEAQLRVNAGILAAITDEYRAITAVASGTGGGGGAGGDATTRRPGPIEEHVIGLQGTTPRPSMAPVSAMYLPDASFLQSFADQWRTEHAAIEGVAVNTAHGTAAAWQDAFGLVFKDLDNLGDAAEAVLRGIAGSALGGVAQYASGKVAENVALAFEEYAKATAAAANPFMAGFAPLHMAAARQHGVAALKWGLLAGLAGGAQGAVAGGGGGGRSGGLQSGAFDPAGRIAQGLEQRGGETHIYIDPIDANNPVHVRELGRVVRMAQDRGHVQVHRGRH